jgi:hypothetical protein
MISYSAQRQHFEANTMRLMRLARAALIYLSPGMDREEKRRAKGRDPTKIAPMSLDIWRDAWKRLVDGVHRLLGSQYQIVGFASEPGPYRIQPVCGFNISAVPDGDFMMDGNFESATLDKIGNVWRRRMARLPEEFSRRVK